MAGRWHNTRQQVCFRHQGEAAPDPRASRGLPAYAAITTEARQLDASAETLRKWIYQEVDEGNAPPVTGGVGVCGELISPVLVKRIELMELPYWHAAADLAAINSCISYALSPI